MTAEIFKIGGHKIDESAPNANPAVTEIIGILNEQNKEGTISGLITVIIRPNGDVITNWRIMPDTPGMFAAYIGAMEIAKHELIAFSSATEDEE